VMLLLVEVPAMDLSLSTSVAARSLEMSSLFEILGTSAAASLPAMCFLGEGLAVLFLTPSFAYAAVVFYFRFFLPVSLLSLLATSSEGFMFTDVTDVLLVAEEEEDGGDASRRGQCWRWLRRMKTWLLWRRRTKTWRLWRRTPMVAAAADDKDAVAAADMDDDGGSPAEDGSGGWWGQRKRPHRRMMMAMAAVDGNGERSDGRGG
jgi:hypothetical protein